MKAYYNSVAGFEGQWYLFVMDENDHYIVHPLLPSLIGSDIKDVVESEGYELGKEIAAATEEGHWVDYLWPHPVTLQDAPKAAYAVRHDGLIFASGYYPELEDPAAYTQAYVGDAIAYYNENGLEATLAYYNSPASIDGQWFLLLFDESNVTLAAAIAPQMVGQKMGAIGNIIQGVESALPLVTEEGRWSQHTYLNPFTVEDDLMHVWSVRLDGLIFAAGYSESQ